VVNDLDDGKGKDFELHQAKDPIISIVNLFVELNCSRHCEKNYFRRMMYQFVLNQRRTKKIN